MIIKGKLTKTENKNYFTPDITNNPILFQNIEQLQIFRITSSEFGRMNLETIYLLIQELLCGSMCFIVKKEEFYQKMSNINIERLGAVLSHAASLAKKNQPITENMLDFLGNISKVTIDKDKMMQDAYNFLLVCKKNIV